MRLSLMRNAGLTSVVLAAAVLSACGNVSHKVATDGSGAEQLVWPAPNKVTPIHRGGTFPDMEQLQLIKSGMNKQQIMALIGAPHFSEGLTGVREWNYLFNFRDKASGEVAQCQYKIFFDDQKLARSFYWEPHSCADRLITPKHEREPEPQAMRQPKEHAFALSADALFAFDKSDAGHIRPNGRQELDTLAKKIADAGDDVASVQVVGYTDRLGSDAYNEALSKRRAETVMHYLVKQGVAEAKVSAEGRGKAEPVAECNNGKRAALIACLAPNRRVVVTVDNAHG
jgi:OOP family OmpA-OmpF porin